MALLRLSGDEQHVIFGRMCNPLDPGVAVAFGSCCNELRALVTPALLQPLRADHEVAAALCLKVGYRSCQELREAKEVYLLNKGLTAADLVLLGTLGSVLSALERLTLFESYGSAIPDGVQLLAEGLGAGALPAMTTLKIFGMRVGDTGASALASTLGQGALPRLKALVLCSTAIGDAGLVALAPALRRRHALEELTLMGNTFGDKGLAALVAPPLPAGAPTPTSGALAKLTLLYLRGTQITDAGCAALTASLDNGALPALEGLYLYDSSACDSAIEGVHGALARDNRLVR